MYRATEQSCTLTPDERASEAQRIVTMLEDVQDHMTPTETGFVEKMDGCSFCSIKQLFWLRDIKEKYL